VAGSFVKSGGIITGYGSDSSNGNSVRGNSSNIRNFRGHAVFAGSDSEPVKIRENTADESDNLSYNRYSNAPVRYSGAWDN